MSWWDNHKDHVQWSFACAGAVRHDAEKTVFPGSASQLLVASAAMSRLGADRRFVTRVLVAETPEGYGLTLVGGGDPTLRYGDLLVLAQSLHDRGIRAACGPLYVDDTLFDDVRQGAGWFWDEESEPHQAQLSALSVDGNCALVQVHASEAGQDQVVDLGRAQGYLRVAGVEIGSHRQDGVNPAQNHLVSRRRGSNLLEICDRTEGAARAMVTVDDPALYAGHLFLQALAEVGIAVSERTKRVCSLLHGSNGGDCLAEHRSAPLIEILAQHCPGSGSSLVYELLLKHLGIADGQPGNSQRGLAVVDELMTPIIGTSYRLMDGAGLSRYNLLSASHLVALLTHIDKFQPELAELLPVGGRGRVICTRGRSAAGVLGYWGDDHRPLALLAFGSLNGVGDQELLQVVSELLSAGCSGCLDVAASAQSEVAAASANAQQESVNNPLLTDLDELLCDPLLRHGSVGMHVVDAESGCEVYSHLPDTAFTPASNTKLFTSAAAIHYLGGDFHYQTPVYHRGRRYADGTWAGDLVVKGVGDPSIDDAVLRNWAEELVGLGLRTLDGGVVVDDTAFGGGPLPHGWLSSLEKYGYSPQISALSCNKNVVNLTLQPGHQVGELAVVDLGPARGYLSVESRVRTSTGGGEELVEFSRLPYNNRVVLMGEIPIDHAPVEITITVENPSIFFGKVLLDTLIAAGVRVRPDRSVASGVVGQHDRPLFVHPSPPMTKIIASLNKPSDNFVAEMVLRTVGMTVDGVGSAEAGVKLVHQLLRSGGAESLPVLTDGSGLTRHNLITSRQVTTLLRQMTIDPEFAAYYASLPIAGIDGTLRNRMKTGYAHGNVRAKTGTMGGVSALSGYVTTAGGRRLCFAILMNGFAQQGAFVEMQNRIAERLASSGSDRSGQAV